MNDKKHILIVEDEEFIASLYKMNLEQKGVEVTTVYNGQQAIDTLKTITPDLMLLDLLMPEVDGFEVLERLKKNKQKISFPIIILTNLSQQIDKKKCEKMGAEDYIVKSELGTEELWSKLSPYLKK